MTQLSDDEDLALDVRTVGSHGGPLLLRPVRLPTTGMADPIDRLDGRTRDGLVDHQATYGCRPAGGRWLAEAIDEFGLTGCGGGHFPTAAKWRSVLAAQRPVLVVANAAESEPLSAKDATLLRQRPHLVLDGLATAAETVGAERAVVWLHAVDGCTHGIVEEALDERRIAGLVEPDMVVVGWPTAYLSGESSAIARALDGGELLPTFRGLRRTVPSDSSGRVTLVNNVETLARVALAARADRLGGAPNHNGHFAHDRTSLVTLLTPNARHVMEVPITSRVGDLLAISSWPRWTPPAAVLLGGFGGQWASWDLVRDVETSPAAMHSAGLAVGTGVIAPITREACGIATTAEIVRYLAASSARQCGPCLFGLDALAYGLEKVRTGRARRSELKRIRADLDSIRGRGACHHPDGAVRLVASALETFDEDFAQHLRGTPCPYAATSAIPVPEVRR